jgi:hypothetical protein
MWQLACMRDNQWLCVLLTNTWITYLAVTCQNFGRDTAHYTGVNQLFVRPTGLKAPSSATRPAAATSSGTATAAEGAAAAVAAAAVTMAAAAAAAAVTMAAAAAAAAAGT